jgi:hypothetical protein
MWNKIKSWFKKEKQMDVVDRVEPVYQLPQKQRTGKSIQAKFYPRTAPVTTPTYVPPTQHVDTSFQDMALTYLVLDSLIDSTPSVSQHVERSEPASVPEPVQSYSNESSSSSYSSYDDSSSSRYGSDSSSSSSSYDSGSSDSSSSYSSD